MEKKEKILYITNAITAILVIILGGVIIFDKIGENKIDYDTGDKTVENKNDHDSIDKTVENKEENNTESKDDTVILEIKNNSQKIVYTADKKIIANSPTLKNIVVETNVIKFYQIHVGQSDICNGNEWFILEKNDHSIIAFSSDDFICGDKITTKNITEELKKLDITSLKKVYENKEFVNEYEPYNYQVFAINQDDKLVDISAILKK